VKIPQASPVVADVARTRGPQAHGQPRPISWLFNDVDHDNSAVAVSVVRSLIVNYFRAVFQFAHI